MKWLGRGRVLERVHLIVNLDDDYIEDDTDDDEEEEVEDRDFYYHDDYHPDNDDEDNNETGKVRGSWVKGGGRGSLNLDES